jgi:hypothetical protein
MKDIVFIDSRVNNYQSLATEIESETEAVILDSTQDGVEQITHKLANCTDIETIHILYSGEKKSLQLGLTQLHIDNLELYTNQLQKWSAALTDNANILLYDCNVTSELVEETFRQQLSHVTGAKVTEPSELTDGFQFFQLGNDGSLEQQVELESYQLINLINPAKMNNEVVMSTSVFGQ